MIAHDGINLNKCKVEMCLNVYELMRRSRLVEWMLLIDRTFKILFLMVQPISRKRKQFIRIFFKLSHRKNSQQHVEVY